MVFHLLYACNIANLKRELVKGYFDMFLEKLETKHKDVHLFKHISHLLEFYRVCISLQVCVCVYLDVCLCVCGVGALASVCVSVLWSWLIKLGTVRSGFVCVINDVSPALSHGKG